MRGPGLAKLGAAVLAAAVLAAGLVVPAAPVRASGDEVTLSGTLRVVIADDFVRHRSETRYYLDTRRGTERLVVRGGGAPEVAGGREVRVTGRRLADGRVRVDRLVPSDAPPPAGGGDMPLMPASAGGDAEQATPATEPEVADAPVLAAPAWPGPAVRKVAVVLGTYTDLPQATATPAEAMEAMMGTGASVRTLFETASRGRVTLATTVLGPWSLGIDSCDDYDSFSAVITAVENKATAAGINLSAYDHVIMWTPAPCGSGWMALGESPGRYIHVSAEYPDTGFGREHEFAATASHEMGHNMGLLHANSLRCETASTPVPLGATCSVVEYGDPYSTMGGDMGYLDSSSEPAEYRFLSPLFGSTELDHLGWLDPGEVTTASAAGTYDLVPTYGAEPGTRLLRIRRVPAILAEDPTTLWPMRSGWLTLELRSEPPPGPWDAFGPDVPARAGAILRYVEDGFDFSGIGWGHDLGSSFLVDMDPATAGYDPEDPAILDAPLGVGETFTDPVTGAQVTLASLEADGASVTVAYPGSLPPVAPAFGRATITSVVVGNGTATVSWSPPATAATYPPEGYTVRSYPGLEYCVAYASPCTVGGLANGVPYRFVVTYGTGNGYWMSSAPSDPATPLAPPTASVTPLATYRTSQSITVGWTGSDHGNPVDGYDVRYRSAPWNGTFGSYTTWKSATTATSATLTGSTGRTYCFSARARVGARIGAWTAETCTAVPLDDRSLSRTSAWTATTSSAYYRSTAVRASRSGASLTRTKVVAKRVALLVTTCATCGSVKVYWNGTYKKTISLKSATTRHKVLVGALAFSDVKTGTLKLVVSTSSKRVTVDGVAVSRR